VSIGVRVVAELDHAHAFFRRRPRQAGPEAGPAVKAIAESISITSS
jgi:hypothetical protein